MNSEKFFQELTNYLQFTCLCENISLPEFTVPRGMSASFLQLEFPSLSTDSDKVFFDASKCDEESWSGNNQ